VGRLRVVQGDALAAREARELVVPDGEDAREGRAAVRREDLRDRVDEAAVSNVRMNLVESDRARRRWSALAPMTSQHAMEKRRAG